MNLKQILEQKILPAVTKPSRYLGTEWNSVHKDVDAVELRVALAFPDLYELGLGNLGLHVLYAILNDLPWCWAERAYAPAPDMEAALRGRGLPLFTLESKTPLAEMDLVGFSLQSELTCTSVLNMLDLAGLPLRSKDRGEEHPLVCAGGPGAFNPEPMAPFIDFFVPGDGEEAVVEVAETLRRMRGAPRTERLGVLTCLEGIYVPALYPIETLPDGRVLPKADAPRIKRRLVKDLDEARFPAQYIVPFTQLIHDRIGIEIARGCTHGCRFCQAGIVGRPVRTRCVETIDRLMGDTLHDTGYEEVSLVSLSACDYPRTRALFSQAAQHAHALDAAVSVPSLRLDTFAVELADAIADIRRSGLTFAPEAATSRLRSVLNKWYEDETLFQTVEEAFRRGWEHVKCYFMIGLPTETDDDVQAIADLCVETLKRGRAVRSRAKVFTGVSTFVPKPFTPLQWAAQIGYEETQRRQRILEQGLRRHSAIKFGRHDPESSFIEGLIARADRRAADLIETAFRKGARLDSSSEHLNFPAWLEAIAEIGYDVEAALGARNPDDPLPWDHIDVGVPKAWLKLEWDRAQALAQTPDCRHAGCHQCGTRDLVPGLCSAMIDEAAEGAQENREMPWPEIPPRIEPSPVQRVRFRVGRKGEARFLSNLEWMSAWTRTLRRANVPVSYSQGFHAHPKITFATAPPVGEESEGDYMDVVLRARLGPEELLEHIRAAVPMGFEVFDAAEVPLNAPSLMSAVTGFDYILHTDVAQDEVKTRVDRVQSEPKLTITRKGRPSGPRKTHEIKEVDIKPALRSLTVTGAELGLTVVAFSTSLTEGVLAKPREIIELLGLDPLTTRVVKRVTHLAPLG